MSDPAVPSRHTPSASSAVPTRDARESVIAALTRHFAEDRLSLDEFERRAELTYAAATTADLDALTADVDGANPAVVEAPTRVVAVFSSQERSGPAMVPRHQEVRSVFGNIELDLRQATFAPGTSDVDVSAVFGNVEITVPGHVRVEVVGRAILGSFTSKGDSSAARDSAVVLRVSGRAVFGNVEIRRGRGGAPSAFPAPRQ